MRLGTAYRIPGENVSCVSAAHTQCIQRGLTSAWEWIRSLPLMVQIAVWLLFLPVVAGLWVWETTWPLALRLVVVVGLAGLTLFMFFPRFLLPTR